MANLIEKLGPTIRVGDTYRYQFNNDPKWPAQILTVIGQYPKKEGRALFGNGGFDRYEVIANSSSFTKISSGDGEVLWHG